MMEESAPIDVALCLESPIFAHGLTDFFDEAFGDLTNVSRHAPDESAALLSSWAGILVLDAARAAPLLASLPSRPHSQRIVLFSPKTYPGLALKQQARKICGLFSTGIDESHLKQGLTCILNCLQSCTSHDEACEHCPGRSATFTATLPLSPRELKILEMLDDLHSAAEIAQALEISAKTLESHYANMKRKLGLSNSRELLKEAVLWVEGC